MGCRFVHEKKQKWRIGCAIIYTMSISEETSDKLYTTCALSGMFLFGGLAQSPIHHACMHHCVNYHLLFFCRLHHNSLYFYLDNCHFNYYNRWSFLFLGNMTFARPLNNGNIDLAQDRYHSYLKFINLRTNQSISYLVAIVWPYIRAKNVNIYPLM